MRLARGPEPRETHLTRPERLDVGPIAVGTMTFGSKVDDRDAKAIVRAAYEAGVRMFDTSNSYNGGASEVLLGRAVSPFRDDVLITTKVGGTPGEDGRFTGLTARAIEQAVEESLRRLGTEYIDVYYFHRPDPRTPIEESLAAADALVRSGKVRYLGQSNFAAWQVVEMRHLATANEWPTVQVSQMLYNLVARRVETEYAACADHYGLTTVVYNPLAGGLLTGKYSHAPEPPTGSRFEKASYRSRYWKAAQFDAIQQLRRIADDGDMQLGELALRWLRDRPLVDAVTLGVSKLEQLHQNLQALQGPPLAAAELQACDDVWERLRGVAPDYNR